MSAPDTTTHEGKIAVMQAFVGGAKIEWRMLQRGPWNECGLPSWDWVCMDYRIKPELPKPREWNATVHPAGHGYLGQGYTPTLGWDLVRVVELLPGWTLVPPPQP